MPLGEKLQVDLSSRVAGWSEDIGRPMVALCSRTLRLSRHAACLWTSVDLEERFCGFCGNLGSVRGSSTGPVQSNPIAPVVDTERQFRILAEVCFKWNQIGSHPRGVQALCDVLKVGF